ncbi:MAG: NfeD family protein [Saprospiraceae bacterium]
MSTYILSHTTLLWFILGIVLAVLEISIPGGFVLILMGFAAWTVSLISLFSGISMAMQIILFVIGSLMYVLLLRENIKSILKRLNNDDDLENEFVGKKGQAITLIDKDQGKIQFKGTQWQAKSEGVIQPGEEVLILEQNSINLKVKSLKH